MSVEGVFSYGAMLDLTKRLCRIPSVSGNAAMENACADLIERELSSVLPREGAIVRKFCCEGDALQRSAVIALMRSKTPTAKTVLLTGHFDVVGTAVCGEMAETAFDPDGYTRLLAGKNLPEDVRKDLESGNWLFGRGTMDMKAGLAIFIEYFKKCAKADPGINIAFLAVPDEEADSAGMRGSLKELCALIEAEKLEVVAALTGEPCFWTDGPDAARPYYTGSTGKVMPLVVAIGREAHVGCYYDGFSSALMIANAVSRIEAHPVMMDGVEGEPLTPPACLQMRVNRDGYSVTLPDTAVAWFNVLATENSPGDVIGFFRKKCAEAMNAAISQVAASRAVYCAKGGVAGNTPQTGHVFTVKNVMDAAARKIGAVELSRRIGEVCAGLPEASDVREKAVAVLLKVIEWSEIPAPAYVVGFVPPFYPARINRRATENERILAAVVDRTVLEAATMSCDGRVVRTEVFGGITDLSYLGGVSGGDVASDLCANMPGWGLLYGLPVRELQSLDIPVANMGPAGRDAHGKYERLELDYSFAIAPALLVKAVQDIALRSNT